MEITVEGLPLDAYIQKKVAEEVAKIAVVPQVSDGFLKGKEAWIWLSEYTGMGRDNLMRKIIKNSAFRTSIDISKNPDTGWVIFPQNRTGGSSGYKFNRKKAIEWLNRKGFVLNAVLR
ncbi:DUF771 domain-containing protein [Lactococcus lactis]|uniref:DUF771 domain-containing protein n=1 Tax=Lactococcus lactis TaxID=1358 RepID=A0AAW5TFZ4_9LACT|nr:DUF771 domain-containing protein [Lactococcus lactis]MCW2279904.1 hypothetical protein [Lactococcus lactis]